MHKIQSLEEYIVSQNPFKISNPFQAHFINDLSKMYLVNCNKKLYCSSIYAVQDLT